MCRHLPVVFSLLIAVGISACGASTGPTAPTAPPTAVFSPAPVPQPGPQPGPQPTYTLSGVVSELTAGGTAPAEGVRLYCDSCGSPDGHTFTSSDANGFYSFSWAQNGVHPLLVWKDGYDVIDPAGRFADGTAVKNARVDGDTRFDIQIVRR